MKDATALVPAIWQAEVANALFVKERQKRMAEVFLKKLVKHVGELPVEVDLAAAHETFERVASIASPPDHEARHRGPGAVGSLRGA